MLIQQVVGAVGALLVQNAFGFGAAEPRPVGFGLFRRLLAFAAFLESLQVDQVAHACPRHARRKWQATIFSKVWVVSRLGRHPENPRYQPLIASKKYVPLCGNQIFSCSSTGPRAMGDR